MQYAACAGELCVILISPPWVQAQLRGMIGDFKGGDEMLLSQALEAFDSLTNTTTEYRAALEGKSAVAAPEGTSQANTGPRLQPPGSNPFQVGALLAANLGGGQAHLSKQLGRHCGHMSSAFQACIPVLTFGASGENSSSHRRTRTDDLAVICLQRAWHVLSRPFDSTC